MVRKILIFSPSDPEPQAHIVLGPEMGLYTFKAIMAAGTALRAEADLALRQLHIIIDDDEVYRAQLVIVEVGPDGSAAFIHVGCGH